jgi:hypothetical protein
MRSSPSATQAALFIFDLPFVHTKTQSSQTVALFGASNNGASFALDNFSSLTLQRTYFPSNNPNNILNFSAEL